jgi:hypothetical protein
MQRFYANLLRGRPGLTSPMPKAEALRWSRLGFEQALHHEETNHCHIDHRFAGANFDARVLAVRLTALVSHACGLPGILAKTVQPFPHEVTHAREMRLLSWLSDWLFWIRTSCSIG